MNLLFRTFLTLLTISLLSADARPADDVVEIIKQKLVKFPDEDDFRYEKHFSKQSQQTNDEAARIMQEIEKINESFGYRKKQKQQERRKYPTILDSSQYLYPQSSFFPFYSHKIGSSSGNILQPSIRNLSVRQRSFYYQPKTVEQQELSTHYAIPVKIYDHIKENDDNINLSRVYYSPADFKTNGYKIFGDVENFNTKSKLKAKNKSKLHPQLRLFFLPQQLVSDEFFPILEYIDDRHQIQSSPLQRQELNGRTEKLATHRPSTKVQLSSSLTSDSLKSSPSSPSPSQMQSTTSSPVIPSSPPPSAGNQSEIKKRTKPHKENKNATIPAAAQRHVMGNGQNMHPLKNAFSSLFNRPIKHESQQHQQQQQQQQQNQQHHNPAIHKPTESPVTLTLPLSHHYQQQQSPSPITYINDDYKWDYSSSTSDDEENQKNIFGFNHKEAQGTQKEALKEGGIIIQRLRVRKGGIAIAGPGGVATAGSGGTAIVGPGGYALTHPRSLTIAGPGAKVIAIPETTDLKEALLETDIGEKGFLRKGKVVATGPTIYYSPDTTSSNILETQYPFSDQ